LPGQHHVIRARDQPDNNQLFCYAEATLYICTLSVRLSFSLSHAIILCNACVPVWGEKSQIKVTGPRNV